MKAITSSIIKLIKHPSICNGVLTPVMSQVALTEKCNLNCNFCTAGGKNRTSKDTLPLEDVLQLISDLKEVGCKGIEYTGGGEPTLHKDFIQIIKETKDMGFDIGLITNGTRLEKLSDSVNWSDFDWIRVSINAGRSSYKEVHGVDSFNTVMRGISILSDSIPGKFGISYIYSSQNKDDIDDLMYNIADYAPNTGYIRIGMDVLKYRNGLPSIVDEFNDKVVRFSEENGIFADVQTERDLSIPRRCYMGWLKPSVESDGSVYPCCIAQHRKFSRLCDISEYKDMIKNGELPEVDTNICPYCIYRQLNDFVREIKETEVKNVNFI